MESFCVLLESGFSFADAMKVLENRQNRPVFAEIRRRLAGGSSLTDFLCECCEKECRPYLAGFMKYMTIPSAMKAAASVVRSQRRSKEQIIRGMLYPCILLCGMLAGIFLFATFILPTMLSLMGSLGIEGGTDYERLRVFIRLFSLFLMILIVFSIVFVLYRMRPSRISDTYRFLARRIPDSLLVQTATADFTRFYLACMQMNVSTRHAMEILRSISEKPLVALIAAELDHSLMNGTTLNEAMETPYVDASLTSLIHIASACGQSEKMLEGYLRMCAARTESRIRFFSAAVQLFSYTVIGIVLVFVYSVLMMPMRMLQQI